MSKNTISFVVVNNTTSADEFSFGSNFSSEENLSTYEKTLDGLSDDEYLAMVLGPKNVSIYILIPLTVIYIILFLSGIVGNAVVCFVILKNKSMHTATNYYLFSLATSDLTILIFGLPNDLAIYWQQYPYIFGELLCKARSLVSEMTSYSSVLTIVSFSMERYLAICHPLYVHTMSGFKRVVLIIALLWVISLCAALPYVFLTQIHYVDRPMASGNFLNQSAFCALLDTQNMPLYETSSFLFFVFPMGILMVLYIRMSIRLRSTSCIQRHLPRTSSPVEFDELNKTYSASRYRLQRSLSTRVDPSRRGIVKMLTAVVIAFFICWAPFHAQRLSYVYFRTSPVFRTINEILYYISGVLYFLSATVNPILYNLMSLKYRRAFRQTLCSINIRDNRTKKGRGFPMTTVEGPRSRLTSASRKATSLYSNQKGLNWRSKFKNNDDIKKEGNKRIRLGNSLPPHKTVLQSTPEEILMCELSTMEVK